MKVALVHDWLTGMRGGERCLEAFLALYPSADIFTLVHVPGATSALIDSRVKWVSFLNRIPGIERHYRKLLPLFPLAVRQCNLRGYDLVISLSHAAVKNVRVPKGVPHICYCFTPMRYIWDQVGAYLGNRARWAWPLVSALRWWDKRGAKSVTHFVAISRFVAARLRCFYGRKSAVIFPPIDSNWVTAESQVLPVWARKQQKPAFLLAGALVQYKRPHIVIEAFNRLGLELSVVGSGPLLEELRSAAKKNITFYTALPDPEFALALRRCRALIFPGVEDFGMIPVECMAAGKPVVGIYAGGLRESVNGVKTWHKEPHDFSRASGVFYPRQSSIEEAKTDPVSALVEAVRFFVENESKFAADQCKAQAQHFSPEEFFTRWKQFAREAGVPDCEPFSGRGDGRNKILGRYAQTETPTV